MSLTDKQLQARVGREFPGGSYTIEPWRAWLTHDAIEAPSEGEFAHPAFVFLVATGAMGLTWDQLFSWFDASAADGPMFGDTDITITHPLRIGASYRVSGRIVSAERKYGRKAGMFDLVSYLLQIHSEGDHIVDETAVASCRNSIVFPRRT